MCETSLNKKDTKLISGLLFHSIKENESGIIVIVVDNEVKPSVVKDYYGELINKKNIVVIRPKDINKKNNYIVNIFRGRLVYKVILHTFLLKDDYSKLMEVIHPLMIFNKDKFTTATK